MTASANTAPTLESFAVERLREALAAHRAEQQAARIICDTWTFHRRVVQRRTHDLRCLRAGYVTKGLRADFDARRAEQKAAA